MTSFSRSTQPGANFTNKYCDQIAKKLHVYNCKTLNCRIIRTPILWVDLTFCVKCQQFISFLLFLLKRDQSCSLFHTLLNDIPVNDVANPLYLHQLNLSYCQINIMWQNGSERVTEIAGGKELKSPLQKQRKRLGHFRRRSEGLRPTTLVTVPSLFFYIWKEMSMYVRVCVRTCVCAHVCVCVFEGGRERGFVGSRESE